MEKEKGKRRHTPEFKATMALEVITGKSSVAELAGRHGLHPSLIHGWKNLLLNNAARVMSKTAGDADAREERMKERDREIARLTWENEWLQQVAVQRLNAAERRDAVEMNHPHLPLLRQVRLLNINRSSVYYHKRQEPSCG